MVEASTAAWFGAAGLEVTGVEGVQGDVVVRMQSADGQRIFCAGCGHRARSKGRREVVLRDAPGADGRPVRVRWNKRVWECRSPQYGAGSWTEQCDLAGPRRVLTFRAERWAADRFVALEGSVASAARRLGVSWHTVWAAVAEAAEQIAGDPDRVGQVARLGFDETVMASASRRRRRRFVTAAVDASTGQIIDIFDGRDAADLRKWVSQQPRWWAEAVEVVCVDPHEGYRSATRQLARDHSLPATVEVAADPSPHRAVGEPGADPVTPAHPDRYHRPPQPHRRSPLRHPQTAAHRRRAPRPRRPPAPARSPRRRRHLRRGRRLLGSQGESPVGVQHRQARTGRRPPRRLHRLQPGARGRPRAEQTRRYPGPLANRDHRGRQHRHQQRAHRGSQPPRSKTSNAQPEAIETSTTTGSESCLLPDNHPAKLNPSQKSKRDVPASSRRASILKTSTCRLRCMLTGHHGRSDATTGGVRPVLSIT